MKCIFLGVRVEALEVVKSFFTIKKIYTIKNSRVHIFAKKNKHHFSLVSKKNKKKIFKDIKKNKTDVIFSAGFPFIIPNRVLQSFNIRLNSHPSLLPKNKGLSPIKEVYFSKKKKIGVSLHIMNKQVDSGKIIFQDYILKNNLSLEEVYKLIFTYLEPTVIINGLQKLLISGKIK